MALMRFREPNQVKWVGTRPGHNGTQISKHDYASNNTIAIYTVPAGKVCYLCSVGMYHAVNVTERGYLAIYDAVPVVDIILQMQHYIVNVTHPSCFSSFWPPLEIPSGYAIKVVSDAAGGGIYAAIHGWVE